MRKLILRMNLSLDGFVGGPNGEIDWIFKSFYASASSWTVATLWQAGVHIMGSRTFRDMAAYWPNSTDPIAAPMNGIPKVVFTRKGLEQASTTRALADAPRLPADDSVAATASVLESWTNPGIARGELASEITRLKQEPGKPILAHGGASSRAASCGNGWPTNTGCWCIRWRSGVACRPSPISRSRSISNWRARPRSTAA